MIYKLYIIYKYFTTESITPECNKNIFIYFILTSKGSEEINQLYLYARYCEKYRLKSYLYHLKPGIRFSFSKSEFKSLLSVTRSINNFNFINYSFIKVCKLILTYSISRFFHVRFF